MRPTEILTSCKPCYALRKKPLKDFTIEDLRIMIGQDISLDYLIPIALEELRKNILAEGDLYRGDLLCSVLKSDKAFWTKHPELRQDIKTIYEVQHDVLENDNTFHPIRKSFEEFASE